MKIDFIISEFEANQALIESLFKKVDSELIHWRPAPEKWTFLEIICHLCDEEREDFRARLESILMDPTKPLNSIDPEAWVRERNYNGQNFGDKIEEFINERQESINWLRSLKSPTWDNTYKHAQLGEISAWHILNNWLAHDYLHIRQIIRYKYQYLKSNVHNDLSYAGNW